jgi:hypothetical protein
MTSIPCQSEKCLNGNPPSGLECPQCKTCVLSRLCALMAFPITKSRADSVSKVPSSVTRNVSRKTVCLDPDSPKQPQPHVRYYRGKNPLRLKCGQIPTLPYSCFRKRISRPNILISTIHFPRLPTWASYVRCIHCRRGGVSRSQYPAPIMQKMVEIICLPLCRSELYWPLMCVLPLPR